MPDRLRNCSRNALPGELVAGVVVALMYGNTQSVATRFDTELDAHPRAEHLVPVMSAENGIDTSGLYSLLDTNRRLVAPGKKLHLCRVNGPELDSPQQSLFAADAPERKPVSRPPGYPCGGTGSVN